MSNEGESALTAQLSAVIAGFDRAKDDRNAIAEIQKISYEIKADLAGHRSEMSGVVKRIEELRESMDAYEDRCNRKERVQAEHSTTINGLLRAIEGHHNDPGIIRRLKELEDWTAIGMTKEPLAGRVSTLEEARAVGAGKLSTAALAGGAITSAAAYLLQHLNWFTGK